MSEHRQFSKRSERLDMMAQESLNWARQKVPFQVLWTVQGSLVTEKGRQRYLSPRFTELEIHEQTRWSRVFTWPRGASYPHASTSKSLHAVNTQRTFPSPSYPRKQLKAMCLPFPISLREVMLPLPNSQLPTWSCWESRGPSKWNLS